MKTREQIEGEREAILQMIHSRSHGGNVNAKAWAAIDALDWALGKRNKVRPSIELSKTIDQENLTERRAAAGREAGEEEENGE